MTISFFGKCSVENRKELDYVADVFKELAPEAEKAGVMLGFENLLNAEDNARAMDRVASKAFKIYYDVGNSTNMVGVDAPKEIRWLGKDRICQFHFKDKGYLGEGKVNYAEVLKALANDVRMNLLEPLAEKEVIGGSQQLKAELDEARTDEERATREGGALWQRHKPSFS